MEYIGIGMEYTERGIGYIGIIGIEIYRRRLGKGKDWRFLMDILIFKENSEILFHFRNYFLC